MKTIINAISGLLLACFAAGAVADETVQVASLTVKERLQAMERIDVTAEKEQQNVEPSSQAVAELLEELKTLDLADEIEKE